MYVIWVYIYVYTFKKSVTLYFGCFFRAYTINYTSFNIYQSARVG